VKTKAEIEAEKIGLKNLTVWELSLFFNGIAAGRKQTLKGVEKIIEDSKCEKAWCCHSVISEKLAALQSSEGLVKKADVGQNLHFLSNSKNGGSSVRTASIESSTVDSVNCPQSAESQHAFQPNTRKKQGGKK
jgi:hypothetical protein